MQHFKLLIVGILILFMVSCSEDVDLLSYVPSKSGYVGVVNTKKIFDSPEFGNDKNIATFFESGITDLLIKEIYKSGVNLDRNIVFYGNSNDINSAILMEILDSGKLESFLREKYKIADHNSILYSYDNYRIIALKDNLLAIINLDSKLNNTKLEELLSQVFTSSESSVLSKKEISNILKKDNDIDIYVEPTKLIDSFNKLNYSNLMLNAIGEFSKDAIKYQEIGVNITKNGIKCTVNSAINTNSNVVKLINNVLAKPNPQLLKYIPENSDVICTLPFDGAQIIKTSEFKAIMNQSAPLMMGLDKYLINAIGTIKNAMLSTKMLNGHKMATNLVVETSSPNSMLEFLQLNSSMKFVKNGDKYVYIDTFSDDIYGNSDMTITLTVDGNYLCFASESNTPTLANNSLFAKSLNKSIFLIDINAKLLNTLYGLNLKGNANINFTSLEKSEINITLDNLKTPNILTEIIQSISKANEYIKVQKAKTVDPFDDSGDYNSNGEPLHDIYE